jgi:hypothetical protein
VPIGQLVLVCKDQESAENRAEHASDQLGKPTQRGCGGGCSRWKIGVGPTDTQF